MTGTNYAIATGEVTFSNYNLANEPSVLTASETLAVTQAIEKGIAVADSFAISYSGFAKDDNFTSLFTETIVAGEGTSSGTAYSSAEIAASFSVSEKETLSFGIDAIIATKAKELKKNAKSEYNEAKSTVGFLLLKKEGLNKFSVVDYAVMGAELISSERRADLTTGKSKSLKITSPLAKSKDLGGKNGTDYLKADIGGYYEKTFNQDTDLVLVKVTKSYATFASDAKIAKYEKKGWVTGSVQNDALTGTSKKDKIYGSLGDDILFGGGSNDWLDGGDGDDILFGGGGTDKLIGNSGADRFVLKTNSKSISRPDTISDFTSGVDQILLIENPIKYSYDAFINGSAVPMNESQFDEIDYDFTTGTLSYKGNEIAILSGLPDLTSEDFSML
ncbi:MAG: M10 family metallopeptidase C-terminal domain-containing protein [Xenococcus sp. (in: cyanobacteria)]|nr:M10 family metallopeptidase C-terminal domain-containing protein [Xenococcaceae cyanobacterium MO_167.B52]